MGCMTAYVAPTETFPISILRVPVPARIEYNATNRPSGSLGPMIQHMRRSSRRWAPAGGWSFLPRPARQVPHDPFPQLGTMFLCPKKPKRCHWAIAGFSQVGPDSGIGHGEVQLSRPYTYMHVFCTSYILYRKCQDTRIGFVFCTLLKLESTMYTILA